MTGSAVIDSLSLNRFASGPELELSSRSVIVRCQVLPPSSDLLTSTALCAVDRSNEMLIACSVPDPFAGLADHASHGSDDLSYPPPLAGVPPAQLLKAGQLFDQVAPPVLDTPATRP